MNQTSSWRLVLCCWYLFSSVRAYAVDDSDAASSEDTNITYVAPHVEHLPTVFSPRMDFDQWKPLTGRGDPLRNDPTYDYEPPKLDRVHYWIDPASRKPDEKVKSEVLVLGVSSKKPSVVQPNVKREGVESNHIYMTNSKVTNYMHFPFTRPSMPSRHRPTSHVFPPSSPTKIKYEDYSYKISDYLIPMTILVPPPPPPPGQVQDNFYEVIEEHEVTDAPTISSTEPSTEQHLSTEQILPADTSPSLDIQESNLIYQSSTVAHNWDFNTNISHGFAEDSIDSDYAGWGPTTPPEVEELHNDTHNLINSNHFDVIHHPYSFYRPMFSEAPPPPPPSSHEPTLTSTQRATTVTPTQIPKEISSSPKLTTVPNTLTTEFQPTETTQTSQVDESHTEKYNVFAPTPLPPKEPEEGGIFAMMSAMIGMPMSGGPQRPVDNLYAHGSEHIHIFKEPSKTKEDWEIEIESMQTMQPPPVTMTTEIIPMHFNHHSNLRPLNSGYLQNLLQKETSPLALTSGKMKYPIFKPFVETSLPTTTIDPILGNLKTTTDVNIAPMYLIIQGHSKVKTYGSKNKAISEKEQIGNEIPQQKESQVKHLHPLKDKNGILNNNIKYNEVGRSKNGRNLKNLLSDGVGTIEIQEANLGIQYDVSDGSEVPIEIYRKGFVDTEENDYAKLRKNQTSIRNKRQLDLEDILPVDEDTIEEFVYNYLKNKSAEKSITGLIASAVTSDAAEAVDELEDEDDENDGER